MFLCCSVTFCFFIYTGVAVCGFLMFGDSIHSQFTLNMPTQFVASKIAVWTTVWFKKIGSVFFQSFFFYWHIYILIISSFSFFCLLIMQIVNPMTKYALTMTPVALSVEELFPEAWTGSHCVSIFVRTLLVSSTLAVAMSFPFFGKHMCVRSSNS